MDDVETEFLKRQELQPFLWLRYIDDIFFIGVEFLNELTNFHFDLKFTYETSSCIANFLDLNVSLRNWTVFSSICSSEKDFKTHVSQIKQWILARCYPKIVVNN